MSRRLRAVLRFIAGGVNVIAVALCLLIVLFLAAVLFPVFACACNRGSVSTICLSNSKQIGLSFLMYANDFDDRLPPTSHWMDRLSPYSKSESIFHCPGIEEKAPDKYGYAFKASLSKRKLGELKHPDTVPLVFDSDLLYRSAATNMLPPVDFDRHVRPNITYADGHARRARK